MATIIKKSVKMSGPSRLTGKTSGTSRLTGKFIARPVVEVKPRVYNGPSSEGAREYNSNKKEFNSLFEKFGRNSLKLLDAYDRVLNKALEVRGRVRRALANKIVTPGRSWAQVVLKGPHNEKPIIRLASKGDPSPWSRAHARRDYTQAFLRMEKERANARLIVEGMAARCPRKVFPKQREHVKLVDRSSLKEALRVLRRERRERASPKEVSSFDFRCYQEVFKITPEVPRVQESCYSTRGVQKTSVKQVKVRAVKTEHDQNCLSERKIVHLSREERRSLLIKLLSRTKVGQSLMILILAKQAEAKGQTLEDLTRKTSQIFEEEVQPQMDPEGVIGQTAKSETKVSNTVIDNINPIDTGNSVSTIPGFKNLAISREQQIFTTMVDRWILLGNVTWGVEDHGTQLKFSFNNNKTAISIPGDILRKNMDSPNAQLFFTHRWSRFGTRLRFCLNSNAFQVGSCVASVLYKTGAEKVDLWDNIYSALQRNHCKLNAGTSNDAELYIPYRHTNTMICLKNKEDIAQVSLTVLNRLTFTPTVQSSCTITVYAMFENTEFSGMISRSLGTENVEPQMDSIANLMSAGTDLIRTIRGDRNRDNPPLPLQPVSLVPQAMPSFAFMDGVADPVNTLRADSSGQTPHADLSDEMNPYTIARKWGYIQTVDWKVSQKHGDDITSLEVVPLMLDSKYSTTVLTNNITSKVYPPVAYISAMYGRWRGDLEFKFEIFASKFHTGRLIIGCVPFPETQEVSITHLKYSAYKIFDLADSSEFIFRAPWHWRNACVPVYQGGTYIIPSKVYVKVVNSLIAIDSVPPSIYMNVYVRAADNFELMIPRPSVLAPRYEDTIVPPSTEYLKLYNTEDKCWTDWRGGLNFKTDTSKYAMTINIDSVVNGWEGFLDAKEGQAYELGFKTTKGYFYRLTYYDSDKKVQTVRWAVYDPVLSTNSAHGLVVCTNEAHARRFALAVSKGDKDYAMLRELYCPQWFQQGPVAQISTDQLTWVDCTNIAGNSPVWLIHDLSVNRRLPDVEFESDFEKIEPQGDPVPVTSLESPSITSAMGLQIFGEKTPDLKSMCRRYIHFGTVQAKTCTKGNPRDCPYTASIAVRPMRHVKPTESYSYDNRWRNGTLTNIGAMFRLWRGSLRYRFVVVGSPPDGTTIYIQHRYDAHFDNEGVISQGPDKIRDRNDIMNTQYATFAQALDVNSTCTIEVPYYSEREGLSVLPKSVASENANGSLLVWIHSKIESPIHIEVFYSFADDTRYSVFQGTPAALDLNEIRAEPQMDTASISAKPNGFFDSVKRACSAPGKVAEMAESVTDTTTSLKKTLASIQETTKQFAESKKKLENPSVRQRLRNYATNKVLEVVGEEIAEAGSRFFEIVTHLIYAIMSPTKAVIGWALFNVYKKLFGMTFDGVSCLIRFIGDLWEKMKCSTQRTQREEVQPENDGTVGSYASLLFTSIATLCKLKVSPPSSWKGIADGLFVFSSAARSGSYVAKFMQDNLEFFRRVYDKFVGLFGVKSSNYRLIAGLQDDRLKTWLTQSDIILSAQYEERLIMDPTWSQKVFELAVVGRVLDRTLSEDSVTPTRLLQLVRANVAGLKKIEKKLISRKVYSGARYTPSCVWLGGDAGAGKTFFMQELATKLAAFHKYKGGQLYHTMTAGVKYFDAYDGQPMIVLDDFLAGPIVGGSTDIGVQFLQLKSCNAFNMPKSAVEDKDQLLNFTDLGVTSNECFVDRQPGIDHYEAYNRRRDVVLEFKFIREKDGMKVTPDNLHTLFTSEQLSRMEHLHVLRIVEPTNPNSIKVAIEKGNGSLKDAVMNYVMEKLTEYHERETINYEARCQAITKVFEESPAGGSFEEVFLKYSNAIDKFKAMPLPITEIFKSWLTDAKAAATCSAMPEGDSPFGWPAQTDDRCGPLDRRGLLEPFDRQNAPPLRPINNHLCLHDIFDFEFANYDMDLNIFYSDRYQISDEMKELALSVPAGPCRLVVGSELQELPACAWFDVARKARFLNKYIFSPCVKGDILKKVDVAKVTSDWTVLEDESPDVVEHLKTIFTVIEKKEDNVRLLQTIRLEQEKLKKQHQLIGSTVVSNQPKWKTFCKSVWSVLIDVLLALQSLIGIIIGGFLIFSVISCITSNPVQPELHPSGDFKTLRASKTIRARSVRLLDSEGSEISTAEENDIIDMCAYKRNNGGIYKKIINNSFFLIGKVPCSEGKFIIYKARCLGLYNKKFICLEHYINYFKNMGVKTVAVVYHEAKGMVEYDLEDIQFKWTSEGYGVGELPKSAPKQFADITKFMPSERFDMAYPRKLKIFEIWNDNVVEHLVEAELLSSPVQVNGTAAEGSWTINQGFKYAWGGKGCCGSLVIAEEMACPLVAIHTAGVGGKKGFAELLFKETFKTDDVVLEYVVPNMASSESVYGLEGYYYQVGQLDPDMAVRGSTSTRIEPSEIQGVFPVTTEPAPLSAKDPRLEEPKDILKIGASKRCDPPKEFPPVLTRTAFLSYWDLIKKEVKPVRAETGVLTMTQAIEGLPLTGYEPIEMSTSEGYPWVNMRPKGYSNKSWMFERDSYPDGRMMITGVDPELKAIFDLKENMRNRGVVPCSYFTCCLKDARILKEKVSTPGKTRVFEACPIDLTIAYRQYNLDFTAAFSVARLRAENSIGINPDGPEWTELANWLLDFSPLIITADYSAFGPRLNHTVLENAFNITTEWYELYEECSEEEHDRRYLTREVLREEIVHAPTVAKDLVFVPSCGMPSGFPDTVTKNSQSNSQYIRIAFLALAQKHQPCYSDLYWFTKLVRLVTNGDDLIAAVKPEIIHWFNNETIIEFFAKYRIKMTDALKSGKLQPYCSLEEATYLKRGFAKHPTREGQWLAPLERSSITDTANWVWRSVDRRGASLVNSEMSCRLAYSAGPEFYVKVCKTIAARWEKEGVHFEYPPWTLLDNHVWDNAPGPLFSF